RNRALHLPQSPPIRAASRVIHKRGPGAGVSCRRQRRGRDCIAMKLARVHVTEFQSVRDSGAFEIGDITCLVGKNESGKTAILQALYRLNPFIDAHGRYSVTDDYPRWDVEDYRLAVEAGRRPPARVARAEFTLGDEDRAAVEAVAGPGA